jgi:hypothetical protein
LGGRYGIAESVLPADIVLHRLSGRLPRLPPSFAPASAIRRVGRTRGVADAARRGRRCAFSYAASVRALAHGIISVRRARRAQPGGLVPAKAGGPEAVGGAIIVAGLR